MRPDSKTAPYRFLLRRCDGVEVSRSRCVAVALCGVARCASSSCALSVCLYRFYGPYSIGSAPCAMCLWRRRFGIRAAWCPVNGSLYALDSSASVELEGVHAPLLVGFCGGASGMVTAVWPASALGDLGPLGDYSPRVPVAYRRMRRLSHLAPVSAIPKNPCVQMAVSVV